MQRGEELPDVSTEWVSCGSVWLHVGLNSKNTDSLLQSRIRYNFIYPEAVGKRAHIKSSSMSYSLLPQRQDRLAMLDIGFH